MRMVTFKLNRECREIAVNADKVLYVSHYEHGASSVHFGKECFVRVQGELADVIAKLDGADAMSAMRVPHKASAPHPN